VWKWDVSGNGVCKLVAELMVRWRGAEIVAVGFDPFECSVGLNDGSEEWRLVVPSNEVCDVVASGLDLLYYRFAISDDLDGVGWCRELGCYSRCKELGLVAVAEVSVSSDG
jgi:hypothetical protein